MGRKVVVLGVHDGHNAGAALIKDGQVLAAINEERLNNIKNYSGAPLNSIRKVFNVGKVHPSEVDLIAIVGLVRTHAPQKETPLHVKAFTQLSPFLHSHTLCSLFAKTLHGFRKMEELHNLFRELDIVDREIMFVEHHLAHAACAYYQRPFDDDTLVLTLDGAGDFLCSTVSIGNKFTIKRIASTVYYNSPSNVLYSEVTAFLGMKRWEHEYKVMGLAPYGNPGFCVDKIAKLVRVNPKYPLEFENLTGAYLTHVQKKLRKVLAEQRFDNIAAACQVHFENLLVQWVGNCIRETGLKKVACSGGSFLNVKANKRIREMEPVEDVFFYPAADDGGTPVGAALEAYYRFCERGGIAPKRHKLTDLYYGAEYDDEYLRFVLEKTGWLTRASYVSDLEGEIAKLIAQGKIIARFSGRDEWGPRALGNRSILADPRDLRTIYKLNFAIKQRDFWMPFAPSILEESIDEYLLHARPAPYMIEAFDTKERAEELIAALHPYDRTARPQTVNEWNPRYRKLLEEFKKIVGIAGILNTSFNLHGYPIVGTPEMAIKTLEKSSLDGLAIGNWLVCR